MCGKYELCALGLGRPRVSALQRRCASDGTVGNGYLIPAKDCPLWRAEEKP